MNKFAKLSAVVVVTSMVLGGSYAARASERGDVNDAMAINTAKISMDQALKTALSKVQGKPTLARFENEEGQGLWMIEIATSNKVYDLAVDANSGRLLHKKIDKPDQEDEEEKD